MNNKFKSGATVAYRPKTSPTIEMKNTVVVDFESNKENLWKTVGCKFDSTHKRYKRSDSGKTEPRYVIEHFYGWYPAHQRANLDKDMVAKLDPNKRYSFAFESELKKI